MVLGHFLCENCENDTYYGLTRQDVGGLAAVSDFIVMIVFLLFIHHLNSDRQHEIKEYSQHMLINHYAVEVTDLPYWLNNHEHRQEFADHFSQFGDVVDVSFILDNQEYIKEFDLRGRTIERLRAAQKNKKKDEVKKQSEILERLNETVEEFRAKEERKEFKALVAYVVFDKPQSAVLALRAYDGCLNRCCVCCMKKNLRFANHRLRVVCICKYVHSFIHSFIYLLLDIYNHLLHSSLLFEL